MMAVNMSPAVFITFASVSCLLALPTASSQSDGITWRPGKGQFRGKRAACVDGTYDHDGKTCCLCAAGMRLEKHCTVQQDYGQCQQCEPQTYNSDPNYKSSCEPCTSCDQPNANLEVADPCTPARDTLCRCKKNHYCGTEPCKVCQPCKECGAEGIQVACTATSNTVCNDNTDKGHRTGLIIGIIFLVVIVGALMAGLVYWKMRRSRLETNPQHHDAEVPLRDIQPYLPDIADLLGWNDMKDVAIRTNIQQATIDSCMLNHPGDSREQTLELLQIWVENQGCHAARYLVQKLHDAGKRAKAQRVREILK